MFKRVDVHNFRGLRHLVVDDLRRVNLFVGPNNVGKTSLLELLWLFQGPGNPLLASNLATFRGFQPPPRTPDLLWHALFHNMDTSEPVDIAVTDDDGLCSELRISSTRASIIPFAATPDSTGGANGNTQATDVNVATAETLQFEYIGPGESPVRTSWSVGPSINQVQVNPNIVRPQSVFLSTWQQAIAAELADRFTRVQDSGRLADLTESLRILQPDLETLSLGFTFAEQQPTIRGHLASGPPLPLRLFGSGFIRLAEILLAVFTSGGGTVLIDEVESGLYYGNLESAWKAIHTASRSADAQIFASTHSLECVQASVNAFKDDEASQYRLIRLERGREGGVRAVTYDYQSAETAMGMNLEVR